jgi:hypothetical protein
LFHGRLGLETRLVFKTKIRLRTWHYATSMKMHAKVVPSIECVWLVSILGAYYLNVGKKIALSKLILGT